MTVKEIMDTVNDMTSQEDALSLEQRRAMVEKVYDDIRTGRIVVPSFLSDTDWQ